VQKTQKNRAFSASALLFGAVAMLSVLPAGPASAQGLFELLFGGFRRSPSPTTQAYADPSGTIADPVERSSGGSGGPYVAYCVRLCDGQHFPVARASGVSAAQACNSFCPAAKTKVFSGSGIDHAVASDGTRYADLANAFVYRTKAVANCTCNGKTIGGLATPDINSDPTLRPGDIVATNSGFTAYSGNKKGVAEFTPLSGDAQRRLADVRVRPATTASATPVAFDANASATPEEAARGQTNHRAQLGR
jgi:hypothetical protein